MSPLERTGTHLSFKMNPPSLSNLTQKKSLLLIKSIKIDCLSYLIYIVRLTARTSYPRPLSITIHNPTLDPRPLETTDRSSSSRHPCPHPRRISAIVATAIRAPPPPPPPNPRNGHTSSSSKCLAVIVPPQ